MKKLLIATTNPAKKIEIVKGLSPLVHKGLDLLMLNDIEIAGEPIESGKTFEENAIIKAKFYADQAHVPTIADDGGLIIDALNGAPGVLSRRWPGYEATDRELIDLALAKMKHIPADKRTAQLKTCICFYDPKTNTIATNEQGVEGVLSEKPTTYDTNGYPYRALFIVSKFQKLYDQLSNEEHEALNHRLKAIQRLIPVISQSI